MIVVPREGDPDWFPKAAQAYFDAYLDRLIYGMGVIEVTMRQDGAPLVSHVPYEEMFPAPVAWPSKRQTLVAVAVREYTQRMSSATADQKESLL